MHAYHKACLDRYCEVTGKPRFQACPLKCHMNHNFVAAQAQLSTLLETSNREDPEPIDMASDAAEPGTPPGSPPPQESEDSDVVTAQETIEL